MRAAIARDQYKRRSSFGDSKRAARGGPPTMRLVRITSALIAFYLLISAATAYAECAWVLWVEGEGRGWQLIFATDTRAACGDAQAGEIKDLFENWAKEKEEGGSVKGYENMGVGYGAPGHRAKKIWLPHTRGAPGPQGK